MSLIASLKKQDIITSFTPCIHFPGTVKHVFIYYCWCKFGIKESLQKYLLGFHKGRRRMWHTLKPGIVLGQCNQSGLIGPGTMKEPPPPHFCWVTAANPKGEA